MADLTFWISVTVLAAILTLPLYRVEVRNEPDPASPVPASPVQVAMKACQTGNGTCMHQAVPGLSWANTPRQR